MSRPETSCAGLVAASTDTSRQNRPGKYAKLPPADRDQRLIENLRTASTLQSLEAVLREASFRWGFSDYTYTCFNLAVETPAILRITMPGGRGAGSSVHCDDPLLAHCRERVSPLIWLADREMRRLQVVTETPTCRSDGYCGVAVPIHGPDGKFGVFSVSSRCRAKTQCAAERLSLIHAAALAIHETATQNCDSTRFGIHYVTVDTIEFAAYRERERNMNGATTVN